MSTLRNPVGLSAASLLLSSVPLHAQDLEVREPQVTWEDLYGNYAVTYEDGDHGWITGMLSICPRQQESGVSIAGYFRAAEERRDWLPGGSPTLEGGTLTYVCPPMGVRLRLEVRGEGESLEGEWSPLGRGPCSRVSAAESGGGRELWSRVLPAIEGASAIVLAGGIRPSTLDYSALLERWANHRRHGIPANQPIIGVEIVGTGPPFDGGGRGYPFARLESLDPELGAMNWGAGFVDGSARMVLEVYPGVTPGRKTLRLNGVEFELDLRLEGFPEVPAGRAIESVQLLPELAEGGRPGTTSKAAAVFDKYVEPDENVRILVQLDDDPGVGSITALLRARGEDINATLAVPLHAKAVPGFFESTLIETRGMKPGTRLVAELGGRRDTLVILGKDQEVLEVKFFYVKPSGPEPARVLIGGQPTVAQVIYARPRGSDRCTVEIEAGGETLTLQAWAIDEYRLVYRTERFLPTRSEEGIGDPPPPRIREGD